MKKLIVLFVLLILICLTINCEKSKDEITKFAPANYSVLNGFIDDSLTNHPVWNAKITANPGSYLCYSDKKGIYLMKALPPGDYWIKVDKDLYLADSIYITVLESDTININFSLVPDYPVSDLRSFRSCDSVHHSPVNYLTLPGMFITEPIIEAQSDFRNPILNQDTVYVFDFYDDPLIKNGNANEAEISYTTTTSGDTPYWIVNFDLNCLGQIGFSAGGVLPVFTTQYHLLSSIALSFLDYLTDQKQLILYGYSWFPPKARTLKLNPDYFAIPLIRQKFKGAHGLAFDGQNFYIVSIVSNGSNSIFKLSPFGNVLQEYSAPAPPSNGLTFDGEYIWLASGLRRIYKLNSECQIQCEFSVPFYPVGITWANNQLWVSEYRGFQDKIFQIEADSSCISGTAVIKDTLTAPGGTVAGLAFNGNNLLAISDRLYLLNPNGTVEISYDLPVMFPGDLTWYGNGIFLIHHGPKDLQSSDPMITKFRIP